MQKQHTKPCGIQEIPNPTLMLLGGSAHAAYWLRSLCTACNEVGQSQPQDEIDHRLTSRLSTLVRYVRSRSHRTMLYIAVLFLLSFQLQMGPRQSTAHCVTYASQSVVLQNPREVLVVQYQPAIKAPPALHGGFCFPRTWFWLLLRRSPPPPPNEARHQDAMHFRASLLALACLLLLATGAHATRSLDSVKATGKRSRCPNQQSCESGNKGCKWCEDGPLIAGGRCIAGIRCLMPQNAGCTECCAARGTLTIGCLRSCSCLFGASAEPCTCGGE